MESEQKHSVAMYMLGITALFHNFETLARRLTTGIKAVLLPFLLIGLIGCQQKGGQEDAEGGHGDEGGHGRVGLLARL